MHLQTTLRAGRIRWSGLSDVVVRLLLVVAVVMAAARGELGPNVCQARELPQFVGMKNDSGDFEEHRDYLATIREHGKSVFPGPRSPSSRLNRSRSC